MTEQECLDELDRIHKKYGGDSEACHVCVDDCITEFLKSQNPKIAEKFISIEKDVEFWYA